jgi:hypothetical protein
MGMPDIDDIFSSGTYLKASDLVDGESVLTISSVEIVEFTEKDGKQRRKPILSFLGTDKKLVCNKTNGLIIGEVYGKNTDNWAGKPITLYATRVDFGGKLVDAIRVRPPKRSKPKRAESENPGEGFDDPIPF